MRSWTRRIIVTLLPLLALLGPRPGAGADTVVFPLTIDPQHMRSLLVHSVFTDPGQQAVILSSDDGCRQTVLSRPVYHFLPGRIRLEVDVDITLGAGLRGECILPIYWQGSIVLIQVPRVDTENRQLWFETTASEILDTERRPARIAGAVWSVVQDRVFGYLDDIRIDLSPPVDELQDFTATLFPPRLVQRAVEIVQSMRPVRAVTTPDAVRIEILADVSSAASHPPGREQALTAAELARLTEIWELWDALLVEMIMVLESHPLTPAERHLLLDVLLDTRYQFSAKLSSESLKRDFVREQFVTAWQRLSPLFRRHLTDDTSAATYSYLAFFTAADALKALDRLGPELGIEISRDGLIRLARLLIHDRPAELKYRPGLHRRLRELLDMGPPPAATPDDRSGELPPPGRLTRLVHWLGDRLFPPVQAAGRAAKIGLKDIQPWVVTRRNLDDYLSRVRKLLDRSARRTIRVRALAPQWEQSYFRIVQSTAWQESCFRQFTVKKRKIVYLLSYNRTSVGLMQINERIWRGFYDRHQLRWNIEYNARAGCEILDLYLQRYALDEVKRVPARRRDAFLSGVVYAMYNGGPSQLKKYAARLRAGRLYRSDKLFKQKYTWVNTRAWSKIRLCLVGG